MTIIIINTNTFFDLAARARQRTHNTAIKYTRARGYYCFYGRRFTTTAIRSDEWKREDFDLYLLSVYCYAARTVPHELCPRTFVLRINYVLPNTHSFFVSSSSLSLPLSVVLFPSFIRSLFNNTNVIIRSRVKTTRFKRRACAVRSCRSADASNERIIKSNAIEIEC